MRFRKLRIAWSVFWGLVAVLLCLLWVRSYWHNESFGYYGQTRSIGVASHGGVVTFKQIEQLASGGWEFSTWPSAGSRNLKSHFLITCSDLRAARTKIEVPHWMGVLALGCVVVAPFQFNRFSLRTLLLATTLVAVLMGVLVWVTKNYNR